MGEVGWRTGLRFWVKYREEVSVGADDIYYFWRGCGDEMAFWIAW